MIRFLLSLICLLLTFSATPAIAGPDRVDIGAYIVDIQDIDLRNHSYRLDVYVWFRWTNPDMDPSKSAEFINAFNPSDHVRTSLFDQPQKMPDGSYYAIIRNQGEFSAKFNLRRYPFDRQNLSIVIEDSVMETRDMVYVADTSSGPAILSGPTISLPGFRIGKAQSAIADFTYPTNFGDLRTDSNPVYSRMTFSIPVERPWLATGIKILIPVLLILFCTALVLLVHPSYIEGRLGVIITALLTLVALQLTASGNLPEVDYMLVTDRIYLLSYIFVIATLVQVVRTSRLVHQKDFDTVQARDRAALMALGIFATAGLIALVTLLP